MSFFSWNRWLESLRHPRGKSHKKKAARVFRRLSLEQLEDRTLLATLPAAVVSDPSSLGEGIGPQLAYDVLNPLKLVEVNSVIVNPTGPVTAVVLRYSTDRGVTWTTMNAATGIPANQVDPNIPGNPTSTTAYTQATNPSVAFDRNETFYVAYVEHDANYNGAGQVGLAGSGELVLDAFDFSGNTPVRTVTNNQLERWIGNDPVLNPVVAADTNEPSFTDPVTGDIQTDTMSGKAVYVAWNTSNSAPNTNPASPVAPVSFNPSVIKVVASSDHGVNFTTPQFVNAGTNFTTTGVNARYSSPEIVFTQGSADGRVAGGQLVFVWNNFGQSAIDLDSSRPDGGNVATSVAQSYTSPNGTTGPIVDASAQAWAITGIANAGGAVYNAGQSFALIGGIPSLVGGSAARIIIDTVNGGPPGTVTAAHVDPANRGSYLYLPTNPVSIAGGASFNIQWGGTPNTVTDIPSVTNFTDTVTLPAGFTVKDLEVTLSLKHPNLNHLSVQLKSPNNVTVNLVRSKINGFSQTLDDNGNIIPPSVNQPAGASGANLGETNVGVGLTANLVGTVFDDNAARAINDISGAAPYISHWKPDGDTLDKAGILGGDSTTLNGAWTLTVTEVKNDNLNAAPALGQSVDRWSLHFTADINTSGFGSDRIVGGLSITGKSTAPYPLVAPANPAAGTAGIGPGISIALDNTLGSFSPYEGRLYIAYTGGGGSNTDVFLRSLDSLTTTTSTGNGPVKINDDVLTDGFSEGNRPQFMPTVAVDQQTGTVVVDYYDGRYDAAKARVATALVSSIDGGATFSPVSYLNTPKTAINEVTGKTVFIEPIPGNQAAAGAFGFGDRQGLVVNAGHVIPVFSSNLNTSGARLLTDLVTIAAGPRVIYGDMGPIVADFTAPVLDTPYNDQFTSDGTRKFTGFVVKFDRPIDVNSFTGDSVTVEYRDTLTAATAPANLTITGAGNFIITPLDAGSHWGPELLAGSADASVLASQFLVTLANPLGGVGTYSYAIGPTIAGASIQDDIRGANGVVNPVGGPVTRASLDVGAGKVVTDNTTTTSILNFAGIPGGQVISSLTVSMKIDDYPFTGDLRITLISPSGTRVLLFDQRPSAFSGDPGNPGLGPITFDDLAAQTLAAGNPPYAGTFQPESPLSALDGEAGNGAWTLEIVDLFGAGGGDFGSLASWSLRIQPGVRAGTPGNFMDQNQNTVTNEQPDFVANTPGDVFAIPTPVTGAPFQLPYSQDTLPLIIPGPHVVGTSVAFNPQANPVTGDNLVLNGVNNGIDVTFDRDIQPSSFEPSNILRMVGPDGAVTNYPNSTVTNIPGGGFIDSTVTVTDSLMVNNLTVGLDVTAANDSRLQAFLIAPDNTQVQLFDRNITSGSNLTGTIFDDFASQSIASGSAPYSDRFHTTPGVGSASVVDGGAGYTPGDVLTIQGGTFDTAAELTITSVGLLGDITGVSVTLPGTYFTPPPNPVSVTGGTGTGATFNLSMATLSFLNGKNLLGIWTLRVFNSGPGPAATLNGWSLNPFTVTPLLPTANVFGVTSVDPGTGYNLGDIVTIQGGSFETAAQIQVTALGAGNSIFSFNVINQGAYLSFPAGPTTSTGGSGTGATFTLTPGTTTRTFRVGFSTQSLNGTYSITVGPDATGSYIKDMNSEPFDNNAFNAGLGTGGHAVDTNLNAGVDLLRGADSNNQSILPVTFNSTESVSAAAITAGGLGYAQNDVLTISGGTFNSVAKLTVTSIGAGGRITGVSVSQAGRYSVTPTNPVSVTGGSGFGAKFNLSFTNAALPAGQTINSVITVPQSFLVEGVTLSLSILHQNDPDLVATLISPGGLVSVQLFAGVGTFGSTPHANFTNTTFDDTAPSPIQSAATAPITGIGAGPFTPQLPLSAFTGINALGDWTLQIKSNSSTLAGTLVSWSLTLKSSVPGSDLGEPVADQFTPSFRIFTEDPTNDIPHDQWTAVGPAAIADGPNSGRIGGLAVDPSDPSGNTVYVAGASGGVWKTTNFLTTDALGPTYVPLTHLGPGNSLNTGSIAVFGRNNDPNQSIIFVATGEGDIGSPGVGLLRSMDGGKTWRLLDSSNNADASGNILAINDVARDHKFVGLTSFKVIVDPVAQPNGEVLVYVAFSNGANAGIWRSNDTGKHWVRLQAGNATDVVLAAGSANSTKTLGSAAIAAGGTGYTVNDVLTVSGGTFSTAAQITVTSTGALGAITGFKITRSGTYSAVAPSPASVAGGTGTGATFTLVFASAGNLQILYGAIRGSGVYFTPNAPTAATMVLRNGGVGNAIRRDIDVNPDVPVPIGNAGTTPSGGNGRILLAAPALTGNTLEDTLTQSWLYVVVCSAAGQFQGLYVTKDFGLNWTKIGLPFTGSGSTTTPTNDETASGGADYSVNGSAQFPQGNYDTSFAIDPNNPGVVYIGGTSDANPTDPRYGIGGGFIRVDATAVADPYALVAFDNSNNDGGLIQYATTGAVGNSPAPVVTNGGVGYNLGDRLNVQGGTFTVRAQLIVTSIGANGAVTGAAVFTPGVYSVLPLPNVSVTDVDTPAAGGATFTLTLGPASVTGAGGAYGIVDQTTGLARSAYFNLERDPDNPFLTPASLQFTNVKQFNNNGQGATWNKFDGGGIGGSTDQHRLIAMKDPLTGHTLLIFGDDQGVWIGNDMGDGTHTTGIGTAQSILGSRNGNLQITQFYDGATQPSVLAADLAGALFYGMAQDDGFPASDPKVLDTGNIRWDGPGDGDGAGVRADQTGSGTAYYYKWPCCGGSNPLPTDFFTVQFPGGPSSTRLGLEVSRTTGLIQPGDNPGGLPGPAGQWPYLGGAKFAVNPIDPTAIVISSPGTPTGVNTTGNVYLTSGPTLGTGVQWFPIADHTDLDGNYAPALAFGSPSSAGSTDLNSFIYVGTEAGHIFVTFTGGGVGGGLAAWTPLSNGLDGSPIQTIVTNPTRGSHQAFAVTQNNVYFMQDSSAPGATWVRITNNLFTTASAVPFFNDPAQTQSAQVGLLKILSSLQADWRFAIPNSAGAINIVAGGPGPGGATESGSTVTITTTVAHGFSVGQTVQISGVGAAGYNGLFVVTSVISPTKFTYTATTTGLPTSGAGTAIATHPVLYVGGTGGVFRSLDRGATWTPFPNIATDGAVQDGGFMPGVQITDLALSLGNINPADGTPSQQIGRNMLVATTYGMGTWVIRLTDTIVDSNNVTLRTYEPAPVDGPHVVGITEPAFTGASLGGLDVTFSGPVDPNTFTLSRLISVTDPNGAPIAVSQILDITPAPPPGQASQHNMYEIVFASTQSAFGFYHVSLGPNISDYSGYQMDQNQNFVNGENPDDIFTGRLLFQPFGNTAPDLGVATAAFPSANEDDAAATNVGADVNTFVTGLTPPGITDADNAIYQANTPPSVAPIGIAVTSVDNSNGLWQFSIDGGLNWTDFGNPTDTTARLLEASSNGIPSLNRIRYLPNPNTSGLINPGFTFRAWDETSGLNPVDGSDGGIADASVNGGTTAFSATSATASITVNFVNDEPTFTTGPDQTNFEDDPAVSIPFWAKNISPDEGLPPAANEAGQVLNFIVTNDNNALFTAGGQPAITPNGRLTYTLAPDANGAATVTVMLHDNGGTAFGGIDTTQVPPTFTITVTPVNDPPIRATGTVSNLTVLEDSSFTTLGLGGVTYTPGPPDEATQNLAITVTAIPSAALGKVFLSNGTTAVTATTTYTIGQLQGMQFRPTANANGGPATFSWTVQDDGGTSNGGSDTLTESLTISVTPVNDRPSRTAGAVNNLTVLEDAPLTVLGLSGLAYSPGPIDENSQTLTYTVTVVPAATLGTIYLTDGITVVTAGTQYTLTQLKGMKFKPTANANGGPTAFTFTVQDSGGTANGGVDTLTESLNISVTAVNDPPVQTGGTVAPLTVLEDSGFTSLGLAGLTYSPGVPVDEAGQTLTYTVSAVPAVTFGTVYLADGVTAVTSSTNYTIAQLQGTQFKPAANSVGGPIPFSWRVKDSGGTTNGGIDTLNVTLNISITPVNDPPQRTVGIPTDIAVLEDSGFTPLGLAGVIYLPGPADETGQTLTYTVTAVPPSTLGTMYLADGTTAVAPGAYTLADFQGMQFKPAPDANGGPVPFSWKVQDNGGTANGGVDTLNENINLSVLAVNDQPKRTAGTVSNMTIVENSPATTLGLAGLAYNTGGPADEAGQTLSYGVTAVPAPAFGNIYLSDGVTIVTANTAYSLAQIQGMMFGPTSGVHSPPNVTFSWKVQDNGGTTNGGVDTLIETITITISPINDPPVRSGGTVNNLNVLEDSNFTSLGLNGVAYAPGDADDAGQTLTYTVTGVPAAVFGTIYLSDTVTVVATNTVYTLTQLQGMGFKPAANVNGGPGTFSWKVQDNGGTVNGGTDTLNESLNVTITPVNDPPQRSGGTVSNLTVLEDAPLTSLGLGALTYTPGPADESGQTLTYTVTGVPSVAGLGTIYLADGTTVVNVNSTYTLTQLQGMQFKPTANANGGPGVFSWKVVDNGGTALGGADTLNESLNINVTPVNDQPVRTAGSVNPLTVIENSSVAASLGLGGLAYSNGDAGSSQTLTITVTGIPAAAFGTVYLQDGVTVVSASTIYSLTQLQGMRFKPTLETTGGPAFLTWKVQDNGGTANGGLDTLNEALAINITPVNDPPVLTGGTIANLSVPENSGLTSLGLGALAYAPGDADDAGQLISIIPTAVPSTLGTIFLADGVTPVTVGNSYTLTDLQGMQFKPSLNAIGGPSTFSWKVQDNGGIANGGVDTLNQSLNVTIRVVNQPPIRTAGSVSNLAAPENSALLSLGLGGLAYSPGPPNEASQTLTYTVTAVPNPALGSVFLTNGTTVVTANTVYTLVQIQGMKFKPVTEASGGPTTFSWKVQDNGGTLDSGVDTLNESLSITVVAVNDQPIRTAGTLTNLTVLEDAAMTSLGLGTLAYSPGDADDATQNMSFIVTAVPAAIGTIYLSDGVTAVTAGTSYTLTDVQGMQFQPTANANGGPATFSFNAKDDGGTANSGIDTLAQSLTVSVTPVNDAPSFTAVDPPQTSINTGLHTLAGWAAFNPGPNETGQIVKAYTVTNVSNPALFTLAGKPAVSTTGTLTYTLAANVTGTSTFDVKVQDNGGVTNGGIDTSATQTFTVTVVQNITSTNVTSSRPAGSSYGQGITFTAVVTAQAGGTPPATGTTLKFYDGPTFIGNGTRVSSTATTGTYVFTTAALLASTSPHSITAVYSGNVNFVGSTNSPALQQVVNFATTKTTMTATPVVWASDKPVTFTATVTLLSGVVSLSAGATLQFMDNGATLIGTGALIGSTTTTRTYRFILPTWTIDTHSVTAVYSGTAEIAGSSSAPQTQNVHQFSAMTIVSSALPTVGTPVTYTVTLTGLNGVPIVGATISFLINGVTLTMTTNGQGKASVSYTYSVIGNYTVTATFSSDGIFNDATASLISAVKAKTTGRLV